MTNAYYATDIISSLTQGTNSQSYQLPPNRPRARRVRQHLRPRQPRLTQHLRPRRTNSSRILLVIQWQSGPQQHTRDPQGGGVCSTPRPGAARRSVAVQGSRWGALQRRYTGSGSCAGDVCLPRSTGNRERDPAKATWHAEYSVHGALPPRPVVSLMFSVLILLLLAAGFVVMVDTWTTRRISAPAQWVGSVLFGAGLILSLLR